VPGAASVTTVQQVTGLPAVQQVAAGLQFTCSTAATTTGSTEGWCWGFNNKGQLGNDTYGGTSGVSRVFTPAGMDGLVDLSATDAHTCARLFDASAWCWGHNASGKLGNGTATDSPRPVRATGT
jgi:alpha-tubulin suppressor-like RCC1 family protein